MSYPPPLPPKKPIVGLPQLRTAYDGHPRDPHHNHTYDHNHTPSPPPLPPFPPPQSAPLDYPRRRPVGLPSRSSSSDKGRADPVRLPATYGSPPVSGSPGRGSKAFHYEWPSEAKQAASGYGELVYPEDLLYEQPSPPRSSPSSPSSSPPPYLSPAPPYSHADGPHATSHGGIYSGPQSLDLIDLESTSPPPSRPLPPSPYPPKLEVSPFEEQYVPCPSSYPNDRYHTDSTHPTQSADPDPFHDPILTSSSIHSFSYLDMPSPPPNGVQKHPLPATPTASTASQGYFPDTSPDTAQLRSSHHRGSSSSMYSYTQDRPIGNDYLEYKDPPRNEESRFRSSSISRSGTMVSPPNSPPPPSLRLDTDDLTPPPPPPHITVSPRLTHSSSFSSTPPIFRSRTEPGHYRSSSTDPFAPPPPPKLPLPEGHPKSSPMGVLRSQSHTAGAKSILNPASHSAKLEKNTSEALRPSEETLLTPIVDNKTFPLSSKTFQQCTEPWSLSALRNWLQDIFGSSISMETVTLALQGLFTHHVSTLSNQQADKLAAQVGTTWIREGVLFEPTIANTALWNPLSTLELGFTPYEVEGVLPTLTGTGCYSPRCTNTPPGVGRCYSHLCSRTLVKKSGLPPAPSLPSAALKAGDWSSFWDIDEHLLKSLDKREIKRQNIIFEFIQNEEEYVSDLTTMLSLFQKQVLVASGTPAPIIPARKIDRFLRLVFGNVKPILEWQTKKLLTPLRERQAQQGPVVNGIGDIVLEWVRGCRQIYTDYAGGYPAADTLVRGETANNPAFASWLEVPVPPWRG